MGTIASSLPSEIQSLILDESFDTAFAEPLKPELGYRAAAEKITVQGAKGDKITKSKVALFASVEASQSVATLGDLESGMTTQTAQAEQYSLTLQEFKGMAKTNVVFDTLELGNKFLRDTVRLAEQANRSIDGAARDALMDVYLGGNSRLTQGETANTVIHVDNTRGFAVGDQIAVDDSLRTITVVTPNANATTTSYRGIAGTITLDSAVTEGIGSTVVGIHAPKVFFSNATARSQNDITTGDWLNSDMLLDAVAQHEANGMPKIDGLYNFYTSSKQARGLFYDPMFRGFFTGSNQSDEYKFGVISEMLGVRIIRTNVAPSKGLLNYGALVAAEALVEGGYTATGYAGLANATDATSYVTVQNGIAVIVRPPLDALSQEVTQSWTALLGYGVPTDRYTTSAVFPTASDATFKRTIVLVSR